MERERYLRMRTILHEVERQHHDNPRCTYRDSTILLVALWSALHNKSIDWATRSKNWPGVLRPRARATRFAAAGRGLPSQSCMSRRLRGQAESPTQDANDSIFRLLAAWQAQLRKQLPESDVKLIDGRGLVIGGISKDRDARFGYCAGTKAKGYKLHWVVDLLSGAIDGWLVAPMNYPEPYAARHLIAHLPDHTRYVLADNSYDRNELYEQAGQQHQVQWMAAPRATAKGIGHHQHSHWRVQVQPWLRSDPGRRMMKQRITIEQVNGRAGCCSVGLNHLPYHARRLHRVTLWVALKILILTDLQAASQHKRCA